MIEVYFTNLIIEKGAVTAGTGNEIRMKVLGHAGFSNSNGDVICAAVSAIIETAVIAVNKVAKIRQKIKQKHGFLETIINIKKIDNISVNNLIVIFNTMIVGLNEIEKKYPEAVRINFKSQD